MKTKALKTRNFHAVSAQFRNSAGAMKGNRKHEVTEEDWEEIWWREYNDFDHLNCDLCNPDVYEEE